LGADKRAFKKLKLPDEWDIKYIEWLDNLEKESLSDYCRRLAKQIDTSKPFCLVGLSFGGIVAVELSRILRTEKTIIISSVSNRHELPITFCVLRLLPVHKLIPSFFYKRVDFLTYWFLGTKTPEERRLLREIVTDTNVHFAKWAVGQIISWKNAVRPDNLVHIMGTADKIFNVNRTQADIRITGGEHFMIFTMADTISEILRERLDSNEPNSKA